MRALIYGGRDWRNQERMNTVLTLLNHIFEFTHVINGGQVSEDPDTHELYGADWQAAVWAQSLKLPITYFYANWHGDGHKAAGPIRNRRMFMEGRPDIGIQFPGGKGTKSMRGILDKGDIRVIEAIAWLS